MKRTIVAARKLIEGDPGVDDVLRGTNRADKIVGHSGDDRINGRGGNDVIFGGQDLDKLTGGADSDRFMFNQIGSKHADKIVDFNNTEDLFGLDGVTYDLAKGKLAASAFFAGVEAHDRNDRVIYDANTDKIYFDPDGTGAERQFVLAKIDNGEQVTAADFFVFI